MTSPSSATPTITAPSALAHVVPRVDPCSCIEVDHTALRVALARDVGTAVGAQMVSETSTWFAEVPVFVAETQLAAVRHAVQLLWRATHALATLRGDAASGPSGVLHGFDFHLTADGPRLIEINTNAGGVLLALRLAQAQVACCAEVAQRSTGRLDLQQAETELLEAFHREWRRAGEHREHGPLPLRSIAIVDDDPPSQGLYPEMQLYRGLFERSGLHSAVADPRELSLRPDGGLAHGGEPVDLVYNRLCDFHLQRPEHEALRRAWQAGRLVLTPHPQIYGTNADKRRLLELSNPSRLADAGLSAEQRQQLLALVPRCEAVTRASAEELWERRKTLFFKPFEGFGSRGAFDGRKLTRRTFESMLSSQEQLEEPRFLAQQRVEPSTVSTVIAGEPTHLKVDLRAVVYSGEVTFFMARLYRGQTTNLRTRGGGLATVFPAPG